MAKMANTIFGAQEATKGEKSLLAARVPNILSKKINTIPMAIPIYEHVQFHIQNSFLKPENTVTLLGVHFDNKLAFDERL